jgi:phosphatidylserine/phosphatidylglycerophosphate/cardiolipin synthase-like enzyme
MSYYNYKTASQQAEETPRFYKDFESKFEARIEDSREYKQYIRRMPYNMWDGKVPFDAEVQVVPMKAIHLTSDNLERLMQEQDRMDRLMSDAEFGKKLWDKERTDRAVRDSNPAVAKAYRNYQMLLELARK